MNEIIYSPEDSGRVVLNKRGKKVKIRKYHLTEKEMIRSKKKWELSIVGVDENIIFKAGDKFFNPYRKGIYYYQIQSLFLLGCNKWHSLSIVVKKLYNIMSLEEVIKNSLKLTAWEIFKNRSYRTDPLKRKDYLGKIQENFVFFQRLSQLHPYGYKLKQVCSAVDIKRVSKEGFSSNGIYFYRLSIYNTMEESFPIRDYQEFDFPRHENKYVSYKFIGRTITKDKEIYLGEIQ